MSNQKDYFDITIKHKYDSLLTRGKERKCSYAFYSKVLALSCSVVLIFSNCVSSIAEAREEDIKGKAEYFPATLIEERSSRVLTEEIKEVSTSSTDVKDEVIMEQFIDTVPLESSVTDNKSSKSKTIKGKNKKAKKKTKKQKAKAVFANLTTKTKKAKAIWKHLESKGFEDGAIAGILGNIEQESDFNEKHSKYNNETYKGLFQLSKNTRFQHCIDWCKKNNYDPWSVEGQIEFALQELRDKRSRTYQFTHFTGYNKKDYKKIKNPEKAASVWVAGYEGAIEGGNGLNATWQQEDKRRYYARKWYKLLS